MLFGKRKYLYIPIFLLLLLVNIRLSISTANSLEMDFVSPASYEEGQLPVFLFGQNLQWTFHPKGVEKLGPEISLTTSFHYSKDTSCSPWWLESGRELFYDKDDLLPGTQETKAEFSTQSTAETPYLEHTFQLPLRYQACPGLIYSKTIVRHGENTQIIIKNLSVKFNIQDPS